MKKILVINTLYKEKGGEDTNIIDEVNFLREFYDVKYIESVSYTHLRAHET